MTSKIVLPLCVLISLSNAVPLKDVYTFEHACQLVLPPSSSIENCAASNSTRCSRALYPLCASDGTTYRNLCAFSTQKCIVPNLQLKSSPGKPCRGPFRDEDDRDNDHDDDDDHNDHDDDDHNDHDDDGHESDTDDDGHDSRRVPVCGFTKSMPCYLAATEADRSWMIRNGFTIDVPVMVWDYKQDSSRKVRHYFSRPLYVVFLDNPEGIVVRRRNMLIGALTISGTCPGLDPTITDGLPHDERPHDDDEDDSSTPVFAIAGGVAGLLLLTGGGVAAYMLWPAAGAAAAAGATAADDATRAAAGSAVASDLSGSTQPFEFEDGLERKEELDVEASLSSSMWE